MSLIEILKANKGTVSSALGKELALKVLDGNHQILEDAVELCNYDKANTKAKSIRAGAAKIVEKVAEKNPLLVSPHLEKLIAALKVPEPQTRWMIILAFGYCAANNPTTAEKGIPYAEKYLNEQAGVCLSGAAHLYLGRIGELSKSNAEKVLPLLLKALEKALVNEVDWIFEAFLMIIDHLSMSDRQAIANYSKNFFDAPKKSTIKRIEKLLKKIESYEK